MTEKNKAKEVNGIDGQIVYPEPEIDAERAGNWVAGKVEFLNEEDERRAHAAAELNLHRVQPGLDPLEEDDGETG